ncbi:MAG TPA: hypothetical protein VGF45_23635 [Polyangia bacterium]
MSRRLCVVVMLGVTSGCAMQKLSSKEAAAMTNLSLEEFLKQRFGQRGPGEGVFASMTTGLENIASSFSSEEEQAAIKAKQARRQQSRPDGSFLHTALYDGKQQIQVMRPMNDLREFCKAQGGAFHVDNRYDPEEIERAFALRMDQAIKEGAVADRQVEAISGERSNIFALNGMGHAANLDRQEDRRGASDGYRAANRAGAVGDGTCTHPTRKEANWTVNVRPVYFEPYNPSSSMKKHELDLRIARQPEPAAGVAPAASDVTAKGKTLP